MERDRIQKVEKGVRASMVLALGLGAASCYTPPRNIESGTVMEKRHEEEEEYNETGMTSDGQSVIYFVNNYRDDEDWILGIQNCVPQASVQDCVSTDYYVTPGIYEDTAVGDQVDFSGNNVVSKQDPDERI